MRFDFNDEQGEIKGTAKQFIASRFKPDKVRELAEAGSYDDALWTEVSELGWPGIAIAEEYGGQDLGMVELVVLCEELGFACAPLPFLSNAAAGLAIAAAGSDEQKSRWLPGIASGEGRGAAGEASLIADAEGAAVLVVLGDDGAQLVEGSGAQLEPLDVIDATRRFSSVDAAAGEALPGDVGAARDRISVAIAAELVGVGQRAMEMAVEYAKEREQFERPIGAYQGVSHACAKMLYDIEEARSLTYSAAWAADAEPESLPAAAAMAAATAADAAWETTASALQVFGGIGFTWEHDLQFWLKRSRVAGRMLGSPREHRERVADLVGLGAGEPAVA